MLRTNDLKNMFFYECVKTVYHDDAPSLPVNRPWALDEIDVKQATSNIMTLGRLYGVAKCKETSLPSVTTVYSTKNEKKHMQSLS